VRVRPRGDVLTEWEEFRRLDWKCVYGLMARPLVIDSRHLLETAAMTELGVEYHGFGRPVENLTPALVPARVPRLSSARPQIPRSLALQPEAVLRGK
jgi:hypothetical protein